MSAGAGPIDVDGRGSAWLVAAIGTVIGVAFVLRLLIPGGMEPTMFLGLGDERPIQLAYAERSLGSVDTRPGAGHDGKFFFAQANDPWYLEPSLHAAVLDRPLYRGQRMLYPVLAGGFGLFPPEVVVWALLVVNLVAIGVGTFAGARLAAAWALSPWLGLAVALNPGMIFELAIDGSGVVAFTCCVLGTYALARGDRSLAALAFTGAALGREVMLAFPAGVLVLMWLRERQAPWRIVAVPSVALVAWNLYLRVRLIDVPGAGGAPDVVDLPFVGAVRAFDAWLTEPEDLILNVAILAIVVAFTVLALRSRVTLAWGALPFVPLAAVLGVSVWAEPFDLTRALLPVFTAAPFLLALERRGTVRPVVAASPSAER